ncbi:uncharacterized mitochondrial protein AtMg00810-like [Phragmites australis]|uniref:uncharacterized mitochondrial protein AtMg00810-like n=1 Tax=Phragmites australis TaxID=29695 RepID=UPI002D76BB7E|nr:uncharacterized mitochondrial protein AtMg00810-like [Phragmites australis]
MALLLLYVDDILLTSSTTSLLHDTIAQLQQAFALKDLGPVHHFLGIHVTRIPHGFFLSQWSYVKDLLQHTGMFHYNPVLTPVDRKPKLSATTGLPVADPSEYHSLVGALQYLTMT